MSTVVEVSADTVVLQTSNAEITSVITNNQLARLPTANRSPLALLSTQAGFGSNGRANTTINGLRGSYANVTLDGINIQDKFIRSNGLDFLPNQLLLDQVAEVTLSTSNANPALGNGAAQVTFSTPSGTNKLKGGLFWLNRNNALAANPWFSNANGTPRPFLNQNQVGGSLGGPIMKDKLFFYANYEAFRLRQQQNATRVILSDSARQGIFTYLDTAGNLRRVDLLRASGLMANPTTKGLIDRIPAGSNMNRRDVGDFNALAGRHLNIGGYQFNIRNNRTRDNATFKADYLLNSKHGFSASYIWNRDLVDRPDLANDYSIVSKVQNDNSTPLHSTTKQFRAFDFNQVIINNGLLKDLKRARSNGNLSRTANGVFNLAYNAAIAGSQQTPFLDMLPSGGLLANTPSRALIDTGQVGELANTYQVNRLNGAVNFYRNPNALGARTGRKVDTFRGRQPMGNNALGREKPDNEKD